MNEDVAELAVERIRALATTGRASRTIAVGARVAPLLISYCARFRQLLPVVQPDRRRPAHLTWPRRTTPVLSMPARELLHSLQQQQLFIALFRACAESQTSEHGSRLVAMTAAQRNVEARIDEVGVKVRRLRQDVITAELLDVVAGYEALPAQG